MTATLAAVPLISDPAASRGPTTTTAWAEAARAVFAPAANLRRFRVGDEAAVELARPAWSWLAPYRLPGVDELGEPQDFRYRSLDALRELVEQVVAARMPIRLGRMPADSPTIELLRTAVGGGGRVVVRPAATYPVIELDDSWRAPIDKLNSGRRSDYRRAVKKAREVGEPRTEILTPQANQLDELLERALEIEARSWKGEAGTALRHDARRAEFYRRYCRSACEEHSLRIAFLYYGDVSVATQIAVELDGGFWLLKVGYDATYSRCSPGNMLMAATIEYAAAAGLRTYEFLGMSDAWTRVWTERERESVVVRVIPYNAGGALATLGDACGAARRRIEPRKQLSQLVKYAKSTVSRPLNGLMHKAARNYIAGESVGEALQAARRLQVRHELPCTLGYWDADGEAPDAVLARYVEAVEAAAITECDTYLSIKYPSLGYSTERLRKVLQTAAKRSLRTHFDALTPDSVDRTRDAVEKFQAEYPALRFTLPGRWRRSPADADWVVERRLPVRVVKGQFPDVDEPAGFDRRRGFLDVVERLAGRAAHVSVATHDAALAEAALRKLLAAGTPCDLEVLYGLAWRKPVAAARRLGVPARIYIPYGAAYLPYCLKEARRSPRMMLRALADSLRG